VESDRDRYEQAQRRLSSIAGAELPNVRHADLFEVNLPSVDVLIGNPPYVRRWWLQKPIALQMKLREASLTEDFTGLTDLFCYFLAYASSFLKSGGRMAVIIPDSWLDLDYGIPFKRFLMSHFLIRAVIGFRTKVFDKVLVRPVLVLGEKRDPQRQEQNSKIHFVSFNSSSISVDDIYQGLGQIDDGETSRVSHTLRTLQSEMDPAEPWTVYLYAPQIYFALRKKPGMTSLSKLVYSRIGFQTFAKRFYLISAGEAERHGLEEEFLYPVIVSPRDIQTPVIDKGAIPKHFIIYCDRPEKMLKGTRLLLYIRSWEEKKLQPRGYYKAVTGVPNLPRVQRQGRFPWYNLVPEIRRRGAFPILLPRRIFRRFLVVWNRAKFIANENFIELWPQPGVDLETLLAVLNSGAFELAVRVHAHTYGGGVQNLNPGDIGRIPVLNVRHLPEAHLAHLQSTYHQFISSNGQDRTALDVAVCTILGLELNLLKQGLEQSQQLALSVRATGERK